MQKTQFTYLNAAGSDRLQQLQNQLCLSGNLLGMCMDENGAFVTKPSGNPEDLKRLQDYMTLEQLSDGCKQIQSSEYEDVAVEDTRVPWMKVAYVDVKVGGLTTALTWCFVAILADEDLDDEIKEAGFVTKTDSSHFEYFLDVFLNLLQMLFESGSSKAHAEEQMKQSKSSEAEMSLTMRRLGATTEVVQLLDSDDPIEVVMSDFLRVVCRFLRIEQGQVYRLHEKDDETDILAGWTNSDVLEKGATVADVLNFKKTDFWNKDKAVVISSLIVNSPQEQEAMDAYGLKSIAAVPITINDKISMYAVFFETGNNRKWTVEEIRYVNDAVKVLESIITKRIQQNSLASSYTSLELILDNLGCGMYVWDKEENMIIFANKFAREIFAKEIEDGELQEIFRKTIEESEGALGGRKEVHYFERKKWYDFYHTTIRWVNGKKVLLCSMYDVTDKKSYQQRIEQQAYTDYLTGLYNRMCCERDLAILVDKAKKEGTHGALLYMDLDDFKHINDGLGHQYGDVLLRSIAHSVQHIAGISESCYRMGGDEFVIIIPPEVYEKKSKIIQNIQDIFAKPWFLKGADYYCTMSMGVVTFPDDGDIVDDLIKKADISMYEAKNAGKNRVSNFSGKSDVETGKRLDMEKNMREATIHGCEEFEIYYQPIINVAAPGHPCTGAEALIRWNSSQLGFVAPADFIPLAEYLGLINPIGNYVLETACKDCKRWNDMGFTNYKVNVNLSVVQLLQPEIVEMIKQTIEDTGINPRNLTLEVTESLAINDMHRMKEVLGEIKSLGARIALDDFGTGYSSLSHLREIPLDVLKVDQSFVKDLAKDSYPQAFIKMVTELATTIGVKVCVEGIESKEQFEALDGIGVSMIQGFYFDKPMKQADFEKKYCKSE